MVVGPIGELDGLPSVPAGLVRLADPREEERERAMRPPEQHGVVERASALEALLDAHARLVRAAELL
jgi:hypothetical protein